jgi:putative ABC transport system permease protein
VPTPRRPTFRLPWRSARRILDDFDDELQFHCEMRARELAEQGMSEADARREALREFGDLDALRRTCLAEDRRADLSERRAAWLEDLRHDLAHACRAVRRTPAFAVLTAATLALGIGANTAIFSVVNAVILRQLGYPQPEQLIYISSQFPALGFDQFWVSVPEYLELQERTRAFSSVGAFTTGQANLSAPDRPRRVSSASGSTDLFKTLRVAALHGRTFDAAETRPNGPLVAMVSYELWQSAFGGGAQVVGSQVEINGRRRTIVGIMPPRFDVADSHAELWLPLVIDPARESTGTQRAFSLSHRPAGRWRDARCREGGARDAARRVALVNCACRRCDQRSAHAEHEETSHPVRPAAGADRGEREDGGARAAGRGGVCPADRVREPREPAARAR